MNKPAIPASLRARSAFSAIQSAGGGRPAPSPAVAGFRPAGLALAVAAVFLGSPQAHAQPSGAQAIHGQASLSQQGSKLVVTTQNGVGTSHSAINWQSFSVPGGSTTHFQQPGTSSLSINRVVGSDPSSIFGTLSSNGRLVLVNPAGIAVGAGAVVDTAGFTASTLRMSDANALAGRLVFGGDGLGGGALEVNGQILARSGDVVLIAPNVQVGSQALVQSPHGATLLAAGQKVELTGRGLEGIRLELQAPGDQALNLGTLQGDAVGIFAGQLKHSGLIQATGVSVEGGKVVLKGLETADISGRVTATQGDKGGQVHATASKVMLRSGAVIDVGGDKGGGEALIGGGWQGKDSRISNAVETLVEAGATIKADAITSGDGGTVVAWSDGSTRVYGSLSARGGAASGNGGNIETSGHYLDMQGQVDTRAPNGNTGNLLLDPTNVYIADSQANAEAAGMTISSPQVSTGPTFVPTGSVQDSFVTTNSIQTFLGSNNVMVQTTNASGSGAGFIKVVDPLAWSSASQLTLSADADIAVNAPISSTGTGALSLRAKSSITQTAAINLPGLLAISDFNAVTLNHSGNAVGTLSGYAGVGQNFSFTNGSALDVGSVAGSFGVGAGANNVSLTTLSGNLNISDTTYGVRAGTGTASLKANTGSVTQASLAKITASSLAVSAGNSIDLSIGTNDVQSFSALQTGSTGGAISFTNNPTGQWTLGNVTQSALSPSLVWISSATNEDILVQGAVQTGASSELRLATTGSIIQGVSGLLKSDTIYLQAAPMTSGLVGTSTTPLQTASNATSTTFNIGATASPTGVFINHTGNALLNSINLTANSPFQFKASGDLNVSSSIDSGSSTMLLGAGGTLNVSVSSSLDAGGGITLEANRMNLSGAIGSINAGASLLLVRPKDANWKVDLGSTLDTTAGTLELSTNELNVFAGSNALRIGSPTSGDMNISAAIAPAYAGTLTLASAASITQAGGATIYANQLNVDAGTVSLMEANTVSMLSGRATNASGGGFAFSNDGGGNLTVGLVDGVAGIDSGTGPDTRNTVFLRASGGSILQTHAIRGSSLVARAAGSVILDTGNDLTGIDATAPGGDIVVINGAPTATLNAAAGGFVGYRGFGGLMVGNVSAGGPIGLEADSIAARPGKGVNINAFEDGRVFLRAANGGIGDAASPLRIASNGGVFAQALGAGGNIYLNTPSNAFKLHLDTAGLASITGAGAGAGTTLELGSANVGGALGWSGFDSATLGSSVTPTTVSGETRVQATAIDSTRTPSGPIGSRISAGGPITAEGDVYLAGTLAPGGAGRISSMSVSGDLHIKDGAVMEFDFNGSSHDKIDVAGNVVFSSTPGGSTLVANAVSPPPGGAYTLISGATSGELPAVQGNVIGASLSFGSLIMNVPGSSRDQLVAMLGEALAGEVIAETGTNPLVTFTDLLLEEEERQAKDDKGLDNLVDNNQCRR